MNNKKSTKKDERTRNWSFILYPDSAQPNWRNILDDEHIQWIESPLHDKDLNEDNSPKKSHWHILLNYSSNKSFEQIKQITDKVNGTIPQKVSSVKGLVRYMVHMDNPEKFQYDKCLIVGHGGINVNELLKPNSASRYILISEMRQWVEDTCCKEFFSLFDYASKERFDDWFPLLCDNSAYIMGEYIKSRRHGFIDEEQKNIDYIKVDIATSEVLD